MNEQKMEWTNEEIDVHVDELVKKALTALEKFESFDQDAVDYIVAKCSVAGLDQHGVLAEAAIKETGRGVSVGAGRSQEAKMRRSGHWKTASRQPE